MDVGGSVITHLTVDRSLTATSDSFEVQEVKGLVLASSFVYNYRYADVLVILEGQYYSICDNSFVSDVSTRGLDIINITVEDHGEFIDFGLTYDVSASGSGIGMGNAPSSFFEISFIELLMNRCLTPERISWDSETDIHEIYLNTGFD